MSGTVRDAFAMMGNDAWSCDIQETMKPGQHLMTDLLKIMYSENWDLMIAHPPCTYLATSGERWMYHEEDTDKYRNDHGLPLIPKELRRPHPLYPHRPQDRKDALDFALKVWKAPIPHICLENSRSNCLPKVLGRKADQIIQPHEFGHEATKETHLWLKNLPPLVPTDIVGKGEMYITGKGGKISKAYSNNKSKNARSKTFDGIAYAMATQWNEERLFGHGGMSSAALMVMAHRKKKPVKNTVKKSVKKM
jgi:hypothetical protein